MEQVVDEELRLIQERYDNTPRLLGITLPRAVADRAFKETWDRLSDEGNPDWLMLMAVYSVVLNERAYHGAENKGLSPEEVKSRTLEWIGREELESDFPIDLTTLTYEAISIQIDIAIYGFLTRVGFVIKANPPNLKALRTFAQDRFGYLALDVEHDAVF